MVIIDIILYTEIILMLEKEVFFLCVYGNTILVSILIMTRLEKVNLEH